MSNANPRAESAPSNPELPSLLAQEEEARRLINIHVEGAAYCPYGDDCAQGHVRQFEQDLDSYRSAIERRVRAERETPTGYRRGSLQRSLLRP